MNTGLKAWRLEGLKQPPSDFSSSGLHAGVGGWLGTPERAAGRASLEPIGGGSAAFCATKRLE
jgi:hypothetical protein